MTTHACNLSRLHVRVILCVHRHVCVRVMCVCVHMHTGGMPVRIRLLIIAS